MYEEPTFGEIPARPQTNKLGVVGFALSFCTGPIGLVISLIALTKAPRGFAIAGVIISLISSAVLGVVIAGGLFAAPFIKQGAELGTDFAEISSAVSTHRAANNNTTPADLASLTSLSAGALTDPWGTPYRYEPAPDPKMWTLTTAGFDKQFGTDDDAVLDGSMRSSNVSSVFSEMMSKHMEKKFDPNYKAPTPTPTQEPPAGETPPAEDPAPAP